jgi:hypothetical protein
MGATGRERGSTVSGWLATISASGFPKVRWSVEVPESQVASREFGPKGVTFVSGPAPMKSFEDKIDFGLSRLRRSRTKVTIPIAAKMAPAPPKMPPIIAPVFRFLRGIGAVVVPMVPLAFIGSTGALRGC